MTKTTDAYVLFREPGSARIPHLAQWIIRHGLTAGRREDHADLFKRVIVIGAPDGVKLAASVLVVFVDPEKADGLFMLDPTPESFFLEAE